MASATVSVTVFRDAHGAASVGETVEWYTPVSIFQALRIRFDLDPASPGADVVPWVPADRHFTAVDNGLWQPWEGRVWLNPPYGPTMPEFMARFTAHGHGIALVYSRTETDWWHSTVRMADAVCFLRARVHFIREDGYQARSQMGSALIAFGQDCAHAVRDSGLGWTVRP